MISSALAIRINVMYETLKTMDLDAILNRKLTALFPSETIRAQAIVILETYGTEKHEQEPTRVRLAVLKLSGHDFEEIKININFAKQDFRDILSWAEYPRQSKKGSLPNGPKKQKLVVADKADYEAWLNT